VGVSTVPLGVPARAVEGGGEVRTRLVLDAVMDGGEAATAAGAAPGIDIGIDIGIAIAMDVEDADSDRPRLVGAGGDAAFPPPSIVKGDLSS